MSNMHYWYVADELTKLEDRREREAGIYTSRTDLNMIFFNYVGALRVCFDMLSMRN